jgi:NAD(P)-dependent dehydrogenase (short-subunit alcohol dehydrogenase family)
MEIEGIPAIVTGGGSGLGAATARALARSGARVAVLDRNMDAARPIAKDIGGIAVPCDVSDAASGEAAVAEAREAHGPAAICVNCAGIADAARIVGRDGPMPLDAFAHVVRVNLIGTFNMVRLAAAEMAEREADSEAERGVIINTASIAAFEGQIGQAAYAASKGGVAALTLPAAREFARFGVRVLCIAPGLFATPMLGSLPETVQDSLAASLPFPSRFGRPEEYAKLVLHMIDNPVLNGEVVRLDSAMRMQPK